jgi:hypothetical protein
MQPARGLWQITIHPAPRFLDPRRVSFAVYQRLRLHSLSKFLAGNMKMRADGLSMGVAERVTPISDAAVTRQNA